jgi:uncharacterized membrane protein
VEETMTERQEPADVKIFATRLIPHRSLSPRTASWIIVVFGCVSAAVSLPFYLVGAWPVIGFLGVDMLALFVAFRVSFRSAEAYETILVTPLVLEFVKVSPYGARRVFRFNPVWVRVEEEADEEFGTERVALVSRGETVEVGGFLGPEQKAALARDLSAALRKARRGPQFD